MPIRVLALGNRVLRLGNRVLKRQSVYASPETIVLQLSPLIGKDTQINSLTPTANYGSSDTLAVGEATLVTQFSRTLIQFDLSTIPDDALIVSATLSLYATIDRSDNANTFGVYRQKRLWFNGSENGGTAQTGATWNVYSPGNSWQTVGGFGANDCEQTAIGTRLFSASETLNEFKDFTLTPTTKADLDLGNGWLIKPVTELAENDDRYSFSSSRAATEANRPKLTLVIRRVSDGPAAIPGSYQRIETTSNYDAFGFAVVADNGDILYLGRRGSAHVSGDGNLRRWRSVDSGATWVQTTISDESDPVSASGMGGGKAGTGTLMLFEGRFNNDTDTFVDIRIWRSTDDGENWTDIGSVNVGTDTRFEPYGPLVVLPSGKLIASFHGLHGTTRRCHIQFSDDDGLTWGSDVNISDSALEMSTEGAVAYLSGATDGTSNLVCIARTQIGGLRQFSSTNGGTTWSSDGELSFSSGEDDDVSPWLITRGNYVLLLYADRTLNRLRGSYAIKNDVVGNSAAWSTPANYYYSPSGNTHFGYPSIVSLDDALHVMFHDIASGGTTPDILHSF